MTQLETPAATPKNPRQKIAELAARKRAKVAVVDDVEEDESETEAADKTEESEEEVDEENEIEDDEPSWKKNAKFLVRYLLRRDDPRSATHASLVGGRYLITPEMRADFYRLYYTEMTSASSPSLFLTERYNEEDFRFFVDIDYEFHEENVPQHHNIIAKIQQVFVDLFDTYAAANGAENLGIFPCCRAASRTDWKLHIIFYNIIVDWQSALKVGGHVQNRLNAMGEPRIKLDMKVYMKGSLRMLGSYKKDSTSVHANETEFVYTPIDIHTGERLEWTENTLEEYSIFLTPRQTESLEESRREGGLVDEFGIDLGTTKESLKVTEPTQYTGSGLVSQGSALYECIKEHFGERIASAAGRITHDSETNHSTIDCSKKTYCPLAKRYHTSNHPYIILSEFGMRVKCHSTTDEVCRKGGQLIPRKTLPDDVIAELPTVEEPDYSTLEGQARLLHGEFLKDGLRVFEDDNVNYQFILTLSATDHDISEFVACGMGDRFVCVDADKQTWYHYEPPLWRFKEAKTMVYNAVGAALVYYDQAIGWYQREFAGDKEVRAERIKAILRVKHRISDFSVKSKVMRTLANKYQNVRFEGLLDADRSLLGFNDGIYDLKKREFRAGEPSDLVSMTVGYNFPRSSNPEYRQKLDTLLANMQPEFENLQYLKKHLGSSLAEGNFDELFHIWSGTTRNGKSLLALLLTVTLGSDGYKKEDGEICRYPYACPFEPEFLTSEKKTGPAPETIISRLARILIGTEPDAGVKIKSNYMKKLTGNDLLVARLLFSNDMVTFTPLFQLILLCNKIPVMDQNDPAVWKRSRVVDFPVTFVDDPQLPNERLIDRTLKSKLVNDMEWRKEFMLMLLEWYYDLFLVEGMSNPPASVLSATSEYQEESIPIANFWNTCTSPADTHFCLECIVEQFQKRARESNDKSTDNYKTKDAQTDLEGLGIIVRKQVRCKCGARRRGVWNVGLSADRIEEIAEKERVELERMGQISAQI